MAPSYAAVVAKALRARRARVSLGGRLLEGVEIDGYQIDKLNPLRLHLLLVLRIRAHGEQSTVHFGMKGLDAPVEHFRKSRKFGDVADLQPLFAQEAGCPAGR